MSPPGWLTPLPDAAQQREIDRWAIEERDIPGAQLMERAGQGLAQVVLRRVPAGPLVAVCGKGNNGGDGLVAARLLREQGREVEVLLVTDPRDLHGDALTNLERLPGAPPRRFDAQGLAAAAGIIDAVLGTGFDGSPREPVAGAIAAINAHRHRALVVACDVPSGVDGSSGEVHGAAVAAHATATFHAAKPGLWIAPGKALAGEVEVLDIGIPSGSPVDPAVGLIGEGVSAGVPRRGQSSTKFAAGNVLVCGGSTGLTGAPCLAAESAARAGAGYVTVCVPESLNLIFEVRLLEVMSAPVPDHEGAILPAALDTVLARAERANALILGPGAGGDPSTAAFIRDLAARAQLPLVLDADGLNAHVDGLEALQRRTAPTVLTPHAGELGRLLGCESAEVQARRLHHARAAATRSGAIVVLKGDDTLIADPSGHVAVSPGGAPALATAGTGDVLSGVIGAYLAKRMDAFHAACAGVFVHAAAGRLAEQEIGAEGVIASDVIGLLPQALT